MQETREAPDGEEQERCCCQPYITWRAWSQETPVARRPSPPPARVLQLFAAAPTGAPKPLAPGAAFVSPPEVDPSSAEEPPQPPTSAPARTKTRRGAASLGGTPQTYPSAVSLSGSSAGCRCPQTGQPGSGTTCSRSTSIVRRS